jgi:hypothetical protein
MKKTKTNLTTEKPKAKRGRKPKQTQAKTLKPIKIPKGKAIEEKYSFLQMAKKIVQNLIEKLKQKF